MKSNLKIAGVILTLLLASLCMACTNQISGDSMASPSPISVWTGDMGTSFSSYGFDDIQDVQDEVDRQEFSYRRDDPVTTTLQFMHDREQFVLTCNVISATLVWVDPDRSALVSVETDCCWYRFMLQKLLRQDSSGAWFVVGYDSQPKGHGPFLTLRTQNVDEAQQNIPFKIVLPTYLPGNMKSPPWISGPVGNNSDGVYLVSLNYISAEPDVHSTAFITVQESNQPGNDSVKTGYSREVIDGVEVLWYSSPVPDTDEALAISFCGFIWNQEGNGYYVVILGFPQGEALKVVTSMIQSGAS